MYLRNLSVFGLGVALLALTACSDEPPTQGQPTAFASVCDKANDGHRVAVEGYLRLPDTIEVITSARGGSKTKIVVVRMFPTNTFQGTPIGVDIDFGTGPNTMAEIPGEYIYTDDDLKVHLADGQTAPYGQKVKVSGKVYFPVSGIADVEFTCGLTNPLLESGG